MTLENFLSQPLTADFDLITDDIATAEIPVEYISTLEPPVESFVRHNEIILSTAISVRDNPYSLLQFIKDLKNAGASALVIAHPQNNHKILNSIIPEINAIKFPVITANWDVLFSKVVEETIKLIWESEALSHSLMEQVQNDLLQLFIQGKSLDDAAQMLSEKLQSDVLILDCNHNPVGRNLRIRSLTPFGFLESRQTDLSRVVIASYASYEKVYGYLLVDSVVYTEKMNESSFIQCIVTPLTLWFDREYSNLANELKDKENFVWRLAQKDFATTDEILELSEIFGVNSTIAYACMIADIRSRGSTNYNFLHNSTIITEQISVVAAQFGFDAISTQNQKQFIIFLGCHDAKALQEDIDNYISELENRLEITVPSLHFLWGYDAQTYSLFELDKGYSNALKALESCTMSGGKITRSCYQISILRKMLAPVITDNACQSLAVNILKPLIDYDASKNTDFMSTLRNYCKCNYNVSLAARESNLHRQSFLYRLEKIEQLCDISLSSHEDLLLLELCMHVVKHNLSV